MNNEMTGNETVGNGQTDLNRRMISYTNPPYARSYSHLISQPNILMGIHVYTSMSQLDRIPPDQVECTLRHPHESISSNPLLDIREVAQTQHITTLTRPLIPQDGRIPGKETHSSATTQLIR